LRGAEESLLLETTTLYTNKTKKQETNIVRKKLTITNLKKKIRAHRAASKTTARSVENETRNGHRNAKRDPNWNHETTILILFSKIPMKRDQKQ